MYIGQEEILAKDPFELFSNSQHQLNDNIGSGSNRD